MFEVCDKWLKETFYLLLFLSNLISHHTRRPMDVKFPERTSSGIVWVHARLLIKHSNIMRSIKDAWCHQLTAVMSQRPMTYCHQFRQGFIRVQSDRKTHK